MDLRKLKNLIDLLADSDISEIEITEGEEKVRISRGDISLNTKKVNNSLPIQTTDKNLKNEDAQKKEKSTNDINPDKVIKSPMVGTFYRAPSPESKPFIEKGQRVKKGDIICIIEAMKLMNEIEADSEGIVKEILVENNQPIEFAQPILILE